MITLTERAATEVKNVIQEQGMPEETMLRVAVKSGGCKGYEFSLTFEQPDKVEDIDEIFEQNGVKIIVDQKSDLYLSGTIVDFYVGLEARGFTFTNPNSKTGCCGCGQSFGI